MRRTSRVSCPTPTPARRQQQSRVLPVQNRSLTWGTMSLVYPFHWCSTHGHPSDCLNLSRTGPGMSTAQEPACVPGSVGAATGAHVTSQPRPQRGTAAWNQGLGQSRPQGGVHPLEVDPGQGDAAGRVERRQQAVRKIGRQRQQAIGVPGHQVRGALQQHVRRQQPACAAPHLD